MNSKSSRTNVLELRVRKVLEKLTRSVWEDAKSALATHNHDALKQLVDSSDIDILGTDAVPILIVAFDRAFQACTTATAAAAAAAAAHAHRPTCTTVTPCDAKSSSWSMNPLKLLGIWPPKQQPSPSTDIGADACKQASALLARLLWPACEDVGWTSAAAEALTGDWMSALACIVQASCQPERSWSKLIEGTAPLLTTLFSQEAIAHIWPLALEKSKLPATTCIRLLRLLAVFGRLIETSINTRMQSVSARFVMAFLDPDCVHVQGTHIGTPDCGEEDDRNGREKWTKLYGLHGFCQSCNVATDFRLRSLLTAHGARLSARELLVCLDFRRQRFEVELNATEPKTCKSKKHSTGFFDRVFYRNLVGSTDDNSHSTRAPEVKTADGAPLREWMVRFGQPLHSDEHPLSEAEWLSLLCLLLNLSMPESPDAAMDALCEAFGSARNDAHHPQDRNQMDDNRVDVKNTTAWTCSRCTYENPPSANNVRSLVCKVCESVFFTSLAPVATERVERNRDVRLLWHLPLGAWNHWMYMPLVFHALCMALGVPGFNSAEFKKETGSRRRLNDFATAIPSILRLRAMFRFVPGFPESQNLAGPPKSKANEWDYGQEANEVLDRQAASLWFSLLSLSMGASNEFATGCDGSFCVENFADPNDMCVRCTIFRLAWQLSRQAFADRLAAFAFPTVVANLVFSYLSPATAMDFQQKSSNVSF